MESDVHRVVRGQRPCQAVTQRFIRWTRREGAKQSVKNNENAAEVLIQAGSVRSVMHLMMAWGIQDPFKGSERGCELGMNEELITKIDTHHAEHGKRVKAKPHHWQEKQEIAGKQPRPSEPYACG